jgi:hypothetical protein
MSKLTFELQATRTSLLELKLGEYMIGDKGDQGQQGEPGPQGTLTDADQAKLDKAVTDSQSAAAAAAGSADAAATSASKAKTSETNSAASAGAASNSATAAGAQAVAAADSASNAAGSATNADASASAAATSETDAAQWEALAHDWATQCEGSATDAAASAASASASASDASDAADRAEAAAGNADTSGLVPVDGSRPMTGALQTPGLILLGDKPRFTGVAGAHINDTLGYGPCFQAPGSYSWVGSIPTGGGVGGFVAYNNSDTANASTVQLFADYSATHVRSLGNGSAYARPLYLEVGSKLGLCIDSNGNTIFAGTSTTGITDGTAATDGGFFMGASPAIAIQNSASANEWWSKKTAYTNGTFVSIRVGATQVGAIVTNDGATTQYVTTSDHRLKTDVQPLAGCLARILDTNPVSFTWKTNGAAGRGFIADELAGPEPGAVVGEKDAEDDDGNPVYQGVDLSACVPDLCGAIKELTAQLQAALARVAALEGAKNG